MILVNIFLEYYNTISLGVLRKNLFYKYNERERVLSKSGPDRAKQSEGSYPARTNCF